MVKTANLNNLKFVRFDNYEPYTILANDFLELQFFSNTYKLNNAIIILTNGKVVANLRIGVDGTVRVPSRILQVGRIEITIRGEREWILDPIDVKEVDKGLECESVLLKVKGDYTAKIDSIRHDLAEVNRKLIESDLTQNNVDKTLSETIELLSKEIETVNISFDERIKSLNDKIKLLEAKLNG